MKESGDNLDASKVSSNVAPKLITVAAYSFPYEADLAKGRLEAEAIPAFVADEHTVHIDWLYSNAIGGIKLQVPESDAIRAKEILSADVSQDLMTDAAEDDPDSVCSKCGGVASEYVDQNEKRFTYFSWLLLSFPLIPPRRKMKCKECGYIWRIKH